MQASPVHLASVIVCLLAEGCCGGYDTEIRTSRSDHSGIVAGDELADVIASEGTADDRCEAACWIVVDDDDVYGVVTHCDASGVGTVDDTWSPMQTSVDVSCTIEVTEEVQVPPTCGRRPQGHHEVMARDRSLGEWWAIQAHLERASVHAFVELADALRDHGAPATLVERCRRAAADEVVHAELMTRLAAAHDAWVPPCIADPADRDLLAIAMHNATEGCVHEAFAAIVAAAQLRTLDAPALTEVYTRIAIDECAHGQLAWDLHAWLIDRLAPDERAAVLRAQAAALADLPRRAAASARTTPHGLGAPSPATCDRLAQRYIEEIVHAS